MKESEQKSTETSTHKEIIDGLPKEMSHEAKAASYKGPDAIVSSRVLREMLAKEDKKTYHFNVGLPRLEDAIGGLETGELIAIGGPTKNGKTLLAQTITRNLQATGVNCLWFTFEVPARQFIQQMGDELFYLPKLLKPGNMDWLKERIYEAKIKYDARVVFVDNLHHLIDFTSIRNVSLDIGTVIRHLKRTAVELNVTIVILCHSKKPTEGLQEVSEWDLRDSSFIPQECDSTVMVQRKVDEATKEVTNRAIIKVCLHRRTGTMARKIHVVKVGNFLEEDVTKYV